MGKREIIAKLCEDLNIRKYSAESTNAFISRLTYSALSNWARFLASYSDNSEKSYGNIYKSTHHKKMVDILKNYHSVFEEIADYYNYEDAINLIRTPLFVSGEIIEIGFDSRISIGNNAHTNLFSKKHISSGMAVIDTNDINMDSILKVFNVPDLNVTDILTEYLKQASWDSIPDLKNYEVFDNNKIGILSNCWGHYQLQEGIGCLVRKKLSYGPYEYGVAKKENDRIYLSKFTEHEQSEFYKLPQRLMYGFKALGKRKYEIRVDMYKEYSVWRFWSKLPPQEEALLRYIGWPLINIENRTNEYVVRNEFNILLRHISDNLEMIREEKQHE